MKFSPNKIKSSLYSPYYAEACNELRGPSPRLSAWATQLRRNVATVASRWRHCADLTGPGIEPQTSRTDSVRFATELTAGLKFSPPTRIHILIQCKLMLGYSFFSVIVGIIFQQFLRKTLKNPLEIQNKSSFEAKISNISENYSTKPSQSATNASNDNDKVELGSTSSGRRSKQVFLSGCRS